MEIDLQDSKELTEEFNTWTGMIQCHNIELRNIPFKEKELERKVSDIDSKLVFQAFSYHNRVFLQNKQTKAIILF